MYKMNLLLKIIIAVLTITLVIAANNRIVLWLLLLIVSFYNLKKEKYLLLAFDLVLVLLLGLSTENELALLLFKLGFIYIIIITTYYEVLKDRLFVKTKDKEISKTKYFENNFERIVDNINYKKNKLYDEYASIDNKIERDLERQYLQSRIRFNGFYKSNDIEYNWNKIDTLVLILCVILFILLFILR